MVVMLSLMSIASIVLSIKSGRFACQRVSRQTTADCWIGKVQNTIALFVGALAVGLYLRLEGHPPIALALVALPYAMGVGMGVTVLVVGAARSRTHISTEAIVGVSAVIFGATVLVVVNLVAGYAIGGVISRFGTVG